MSSLFHAVHGFDLWFYSLLGKFAGSAVLCRLARLEESNDLLKGALFFAIFWSDWFREDANQKKRRAAILSILVGSMVAIVAARGIAAIVPFSVRPMNDPAVAHPAYAVQFDYNLEQWSSFPSDTAAYFFALAFGIGYLSRRLAAPVILYTSVWICLTRVYLGIHFASDIIVGAMIGVASVILCLRSGALQKFVTNPIVNAIEGRSGWGYGLGFLASFEMATIFDSLRGLGNVVVHGLAAELHLRKLGAVKRGPLESWGGMIALVICGIVTALLVSRYRNSAEPQEAHSSTPSLDHSTPKNDHHRPS